MIDYSTTNIIHAIDSSLKKYNIPLNQLTKLLKHNFDNLSTLILLNDTEIRLDPYINELNYHCIELNKLNEYYMLKLCTYNVYPDINENRENDYNYNDELNNRMKIIIDNIFHIINNYFNLIKTVHFSNGTIIYVYNGKLHNCEDFAIKFNTGEYVYAINDEIMNYEKWYKHPIRRKYKISKISKKLI